MVNVLNERDIEVVKLLPTFLDLRILQAPTTFLRPRFHHLIELRRAVCVDEATYIPRLPDIRLILNVLIVLLFLHLLNFILVPLDVFKNDDRLFLISIMIKLHLLNLIQLLLQFVIFILLELLNYLHHSQAVLIRAFFCLSFYFAYLFLSSSGPRLSGCTTAAQWWLFCFCPVLWLRRAISLITSVPTSIFF